MMLRKVMNNLVAAAATPSIKADGSRIYTADNATSVLAYDSNDCSEIWSLDVGEQVFGAVEIAQLLVDAAQRRQQADEALDEALADVFSGQVAEAVAHAIESDNPHFRYPVGFDAEEGIGGRAKVGDEEWVKLNCLQDEAFNDRWAEVVGVDYFRD